MKKEIIPKESVISCHLRTNHYFTQKLLVRIILCNRYREALFQIYDIRKANFSVRWIYSWKCTDFLNLFCPTMFHRVQDL